MTALRDYTGETLTLHSLTPPARDTVESLHALRRTYTDIGSPTPRRTKALQESSYSRSPRTSCRNMCSVVRRTKVDPDELAGIRAADYLPCRWRRKSPALSV
jgi:hypothetical protein